MAAPTVDLSALLGGLSLEDAKKGDKDVSHSTTALQSEIDSAGFRIFECLSDLGYFSWNPPRNAVCKSLGSIASPDEFKKYIDLDGKPDKLKDPHSVNTFRPFLSLPEDTHENKFPYGKQDAVSLHVASHHRGVDFSAVDFVFGGSTLEMLATCDASDPYMVTIIPDTRAIFVVKTKEYIQDLSQPGFQFERLMTGRPMAGHDTNSITSTDHLHLMNVGKHRVLFRAEADATNESGTPVEIKASNPRYWGTKVMFQMISNGSTKLCHGVKSRGSLAGVRVLSLGSVADKALQVSSVDSLERNIEKGMEGLRNQMASASSGEAFKVSFVGGSLRLSRVSGRSADILPPEGMMRKLMAHNQA